MIRTETELLVWLRDAVADLLELDAAAIDPDRPLTELGISSRDAVGLVGDLEDFLDRDLDATLVWQTPTITALAALLCIDPDLDTASQPSNAAPAAVVPASSTLDGAAAAGIGTGREPVAIIGIGCRLPGGSTGPDAFWDLLREGRDAVTEVPSGRWEEFAGPATPGFGAVERTNRSGGFLGDVSGFDAEFFGISPREAELMDPQQRMLLEVVVEAMDHAGLRPEDLRGSDTGVYVGMSTNEYSHLATADLARIDAWTATGSAFSIAANRISYLFDLRGPSMTLDTACSSSLVAIHQACRSIADGEITQAFVAGVNLLLAPAITMTFDQAGALAPEGGSKPFSADADGIARAEGAGVIVLKRLSDAQADGDRILAVVRGSGVNSDGRSNGLTAPNPLAQEALLRDVYARAGIDPASVDYVEAHGTGTLLGDPIEAAALGAALGAGRATDKPLLIGSVKSNLGHLESAAGMAGVIKVVLGMQHDVIPASLKYAGPNPHIRFGDWHLSVADTAQPWPRYGGRALAGVSGFGFGGTNAHTVIEEWPQAVQPDAGAGHDQPVALPLSAMNADRIRDRAGALAAWLADAGAQTPLADVAHTLTRRRGRGLAATVVAGRGRAGLVEALQAFAGGAEPSGMPRGTVALPPIPRTAATRPGTDRAVWVFSGWGSQWAGMGRQLLADEPAFAAAIDELDPLVQAEAGFGLRAAIEGRAKVSGVAAIQIVLFGIQVALAALWRSYGVQPAAVIGHSMGEVAAAVVAGGISAADGVKVIVVRSRLIEAEERNGSGAMAVIELDAAELDRLADRFPDVGVCVYGSPSQLTVGSPDATQIAGLVEYVESLGRNAWPLKVRGAAHSPAIDVILPAMREQLAGVTPLTPSVPFYSTANEDPRAAVTFDVEYWLRNARQPVRFAQTVAAAAEDGHPAYLEISPHPIAVSAVKQSVAGRIGAELLVTGTLRRDGDDGVVFRANAMALQQAGLALDLEALVPAGAQADLADRVWRHKRFWVETVEGIVPAAAVDGHPLLGVHVELPEGGRHLWRADVGTARLPWLNDHQVFGVPVLPVAAYAEMALAAAREILAPGQPESAVQLTELDLSALMSLGEHTDLTTSLTMLSAGQARVEIFARPPGAPSSTAAVKHASATVRRVPAGQDSRASHESDLVVDLTAVESGRPVDLYAVMRAAGHEYGPAFVGVSQARLASDGVAVARATLPDAVAANQHFTVHPVLLDICLQTLVVSGLALLDDPDNTEAGGTILPVGVGSIRVHANPGRGGLVTAQLRRSGEGELAGSVRVVGEDGQLLLEIHDVLLRQIDADDVAVPLPELLLATSWEPAELPSAPKGTAASSDWLLVDAAADPVIAGILTGAPELLAAGAQQWPDDLRLALESSGQQVHPTHPDDLLDALRNGLAGANVVVMTPVMSAVADAVGSELGLRMADELIRFTATLLSDLDARPEPALVHLVSADAFPVEDGEAGRPAVAVLRGLVRSRAMDPSSGPGGSLSRVVLIDADAAADVGRELVASAAGSAIATTAASGARTAADDEIAWRRSTRFAHRLHRVSLPDLGEPFTLRPGGYVVVNGLGMPGIMLAESLIGRLAGAGVSRVVLAGPAHAGPAEAEAISHLIASGTEVEITIADLSDRDAIKRLVDAATAGDLPLRGLIQAPDGTSWSQATPDVSKSVARAAWLLHEVSIGHQLDVWMLRSASAALLGSPAAPLEAELAAWLDALVQWRRAQGLPATSIQWGDISELEDGQVASAFGLLGPSQPVLGLDRLTGEFRAAAAALPYYAAVTGENEDLDGAGQWIGPEGLRAMAPAAARQALADRLRLRVAAVMGHRPQDIDVTVPLSSLGVDSLMAMRAKNAVEHDVRITMPVRLLLQGASLVDLEAYLAEQLGIDVGAAPVVSEVAKADVEARDGTERWLVAAWAQVIGRTPSSVCAPVSQFGDADAARAVTTLILQRLQDQPGAAEHRAQWPAEEDLLGASTIEEQADLVRELIENVGDSPMRVLSPGAVGERPLFVFHPAGGTTSVYYPMVSQLGDDVPVYGMERLDGLRGIDDKVEEYLRLIRNVQPEGPYRVGGWSFGGALAYRTAQHLRDQGEEVELLFMIDTILARSDDATSERDMLAGRFERFIEYLETTYELDLDIDVQWLVDLNEDEQIQTLMRLVEESGANLSPALMEHQRTSYEDARIAEKFAPSLYGSGRVVLYRSTERGLTTTIDPRYARTEDSLGWDVYCSDLEVVHVPGNHTSMIDRPQVDTMAAHLSRSLGSLTQVVRHV